MQNSATNIQRVIFETKNILVKEREHMKKVLKQALGLLLCSALLLGDTPIQGFCTELGSDAICEEIPNEYGTDNLSSVTDVSSGNAVIIYEDNDVSKNDVLVEDESDPYIEFIEMGADEDENPLSGKCGDNVTWTLDPDAMVLTISGTGAMYDYESGTSEDKSGWSPYRQYCYSNTAHYTKIIIEEGVTRIGNNAFYMSDMLEEISISNTVEEIGDNAFSNCSLAKITIPPSVKSIGNSALGFSLFTEIIFPEGLESLGNSVLVGCSFLKSIVLPASLKSIGNSLLGSREYFIYCNNVNSVTYNGTGDDWKKVSIGTGNDELIAMVTAGEGPAPQTVFTGKAGKSAKWEVDLDTKTLTLSGSGALNSYSENNPAPWMEYRRDIENIIIGEKITSLSTYCFYRLNEVSKVIIPESIKKIPDYAFDACNSLEEVVLPDSVTEIGVEAFSDTALKTVKSPSSLKKIGVAAFMDSDLSEFVFNEGLTTIGANAFWGTNLSEVLLPNSVVSIGDYAFDHTNIRKLFIPYSVSEIGEGAFSSLSASTLVIYSGTEESWRKIKIGDTNNLSNVSFSTYLDSGVLDNGIAWEITYDGALYIYGSGIIESKESFIYLSEWSDYVEIVYIGEGITEIGNSFFENMETISELYLPESLKSIGSYAFQNCNKLKEVIIPDSVETIGANTFLNCANLKYVNFGKGIKFLDVGCFDSCSIETLKLDTSGIVLCERAFYYNNINTIYLPKEIEAFSAFSFNPPLEHLYYDGDIVQFNNLAETGLKENFSYLYSSLNKTFKPVNVSGKWGDNLTYTISDRVLTISGRGKMSESTNDVYPWSKYISYDYGLVDKIIVNKGVDNIADYAFADSSSVSVVLPSSIKEIGEYAFASSDIKHIDVPEGVTTLGEDCFFNCASLESVSIPKSMVSIGDYAFEGTDCQIMYPGSLEDFMKLLSQEYISCEPVLNFVDTSNLYYVEFDLHFEDTAPFKISWEKGKEYTLSNPPLVKPGYTFAGWKLGKKTYKSGATVKDVAKPGKTATFVAQWSVDKKADGYSYVVEFNGNGADSGTMKNLSMTEGVSKTLTANSFKKANYHFAGWSFSDNGAVVFKDKASVKDVNSLYAIKTHFSCSNKVTLYAVWEINKYNIVFNGNGGKFSNGKTTIKESHNYFEEFKLSDNGISRTGYTLLGFSTDKKATKVNYKVNDLLSKLSATNNKTINLYAVWKINSYTITFSSKRILDNAQVYGTVASMTVPYGKSVKLNSNIMSAEGYSFAGWKCSDKKTYKNGATIKNLSKKNGGYVIMEAIWRENTYTVKYDKNGGKGTLPGTKKITSYHGEVIPNGDGLTFTSREFTGWNTKADGSGYSFASGDSINFSDKVVKYNGTITLYAQWYYKVKLNPGNAEGEETEYGLYWNRSEKIPNVPEYSKEGYSLAGWNTDSKKALAGTALKSVKNLSVGKTLYAVWKPIVYEIVFFDSENDNEKSQKVTYDKLTTLISYPFKLPKGYKFSYWEAYDSYDEYIGQFENKGKVLNLCKDNGEKVYFDAVLEPIEYTIKYVLPKGATLNDEAPISYTVENSYLIGNDYLIPVKEGYTFVGWYKDKDYTKKFTGFTSSTTGNLTLYAKFKKK